MALSQLCLSTAVMKLALPLLVVMAMAAAPSISGAAQLEQLDDLRELAEDPAPGAKAGRGRFLSKFEESLPLSSRRHLNTLILDPVCNGRGSKYCNDFGRGKGWSIPACCPVVFFSICKDIGSRLKCGSCSAGPCFFPRDCCKGSCTDTRSDSKNCGGCGIVCSRGRSCIRGMCGY